MQLSFLGQTYEASLPPVTAIDTPETGLFLGQRYPKKQFNVAVRHPGQTELTYRGIRYCA